MSVGRSRGNASKMMAFRIDDVCPQMNQARFDAALALLRQYGVKPLLGVIPDNQDPVLSQQEADATFWEKMRRLKQDGCVIAMHGFRHVYDSQAQGMITGGSRSEFAGHEFKEQLDKINRGKTIMRQNSLDTDIFYAPAHSFDRNTLRALRQSGFKYVSDGRSHYGYRRFGLKYIPCRSYRVAVKCSGMTTVALHPSLNGDREYETLQKTLERNQAYLVSYSELLSSRCYNLTAQLVDERLYVFYSRFLEPVVLRFKKALRPFRRMIRKTGSSLL